MEQFDDRQELADKIGWEGGIEPALEYGLTAEHVPAGDDELFDAWTEMDVTWNPYLEKRNVVEALLPESEAG